MAGDLFVAPSQQEQFRKLSTQTSQVRWDTQFILPSRKRPDIVIWFDDLPAIVIENKIWSGIALHSRPVRPENELHGSEDETNRAEAATIPASQLTTYGKWLHDMRRGTEWAGSLALLTHGTRPPADFHEHSAAYGAVPHTRHWSHVASWLKRYTLRKSTARGTEKSASAYLASELEAFITRKGLTVPVLKFSDIDALGAHLASKGALNSAFQEILTAVRTRCPEIVSTDEFQAIKYEASTAVVHGWVYLEQKGLPGSIYFGWGLRFPEVSSWWDEISDRLPEENHVFAYMGNDDGTFPAKEIPLDLIPSGWSSAFQSKELVAAAPLAALPSADTLPQALGAWVSDQLASLQPALSHIAGLGR